MNPPYTLHPIRQAGGGIAHAIKTPLSKISLSAELTILEIDRAMVDREERDEILRMIQRRMRFIMDQANLAAQKVDASQKPGSAH